VLLLPGCGGSSSDPATGSSSAAKAPTSGAKAKDPPAKAASPGTAAHGGRSEAESITAGVPHAAAPSGHGAKHGPRIAQPKGPPETAPTPAQVAHATVADLSLQSPAILAAEGGPGRLSATYTCDGKDSWPQLSWTGVPPGTAELALFAMNVQPVEEKLFVDWAVAGLDPSLEGIEAGQLPKGAVIGTNGFGKRGYSICPPGSGEIYMFAVYALPRRLSPQKGFDARELRKEVLGASGDVGLLPAVYARG
jgi:phosphatidylethanolamine-binding protein (PEBP) family uncharacterized protein